MNWTALRPSRLAMAAVFLLAAGCGDEEPTGPEYGDLEFAPASPVVVGLDRQVDLEVINVTNGSLGPILLGAGSIPLSIPPGSTCPGLTVGFSPTQLSPLPGGGSADVSVTFSFADLDEEECPLATYAVDVNAAVNQTVLGSTQVRVDHVELE